MERTLSVRFKKHFTLYSSDLYWVEENQHSHPDRLTMDEIVDDIFAFIAEQKLSKTLLIAHSCFGICALEAAKRQTRLIEGIILVASPPCWNTESMAKANRYFEQTASAERKANDRQRRAHFEKIKTPNESELSLNTYEAASARYWADFNVSRQTLEKLWNGIHPEEKICNRFYLDILPQHDLAKGIDQVKVPVVLAAGKLDFDSAPLMLWQDFVKPSNFTIIDCGETGHWPHLENPDYFDSEIEKWARVQGL